MPNYYVKFSCLLSVGSAENAAIATGLYGGGMITPDGEDWPYGFSMSIAEDEPPGTLWIWSDDCGSAEHVEDFVLRCAREFKLTGVWTFSWSVTCSRPVLDEFGGGAAVLDLGAGQVVSSFDTTRYLEYVVASYNPSKFNASAVA